MHESKQRVSPGLYTLIALGLIILILALAILSLLTGTVKLSFGDLIHNLFLPDGESASWISLHQFRIPRLVTAIVTGIGLSVSGLQMQTVFRNPLAGPYVLGISSGAALGVALLVLGLPGLFSYSVISSGNSFLLIIAAFTGAAAILLVILMVSLRVKNIMTILILGIMLGSGISAIINILQFFSRESALKAFVIWTMGSLNGVTEEQLPFLISGTFAGLIIAVFLVKPSNAVMMGESYARSLGVKMKLYRILLFISTAFLTGTVTAFCGPVGFIGIAVPHIARMVTKSSRYGILLLFSSLIGMVIMLISDILSQFPWHDTILPINAVTSLLGIPVVIWVIFDRKNYYN